MRRNGEALRVRWWWTAPLLAVAVACGSGEEEPRPSGPSMAAPPPIENHAENAAPVVESLSLNPDGPLPGGGLPMVPEGSDPASAIVRNLDAFPGGYAVVSPGASRAQAYKKPPPAVLAAGCRRDVSAQHHSGSKRS